MATDLNGDGDTDLAVAKLYDYQRISILLGTGTGEFVAGPTPAVDWGPHSIAVGDFNRDGRPDLVTANQGAMVTPPPFPTFNATVSLLLATGGGGFAPSTHISVGGYAEKVATADVDGDGNLDLVVSTGDTVSILLGSPTGQFSGPQSFPAAPRTSTKSLAMADFNGDGRPDLAVANSSSWTVSVLLNTSLGCPAPGLGISDATVTEGQSGVVTAYFTVSLFPGSTQPVTVDFGTVDGSATSPSDYTAVSGTLSFAPGETSKTVTVLVNGDTQVEFHETFLVRLSNAVGAAIRDGEGVGTILTDEPAAVFRLRHPSIGAYLFTVYPQERDSAVQQYGYTFEGTCCRWFLNPAEDGRLPLYRLYSGTAGEYFYTIYAEERDGAVRQYGYTYEGIAAYCAPASSPDAPQPWYRLRYGNKHFYTIYASERDSAVQQYGFVYEGVSCYLPPP